MQLCLHNAFNNTVLTTSTFVAALLRGSHKLLISLARMAQFGPRSQQPWAGSGRLQEDSMLNAYSSQLGSQSQDTLYNGNRGLGAPAGPSLQLGLQKNTSGAGPAVRAFATAPSIPSTKPFKQYVQQKVQGGSQKVQLNLVQHGSNGGTAFGRLPSPGPSHPSPTAFQLTSSQGSLLDTSNAMQAPGGVMFTSSQHQSMAMTQATVLGTIPHPLQPSLSRPNTGSMSQVPFHSQQHQQRPGSVNSSMDATTGSQLTRPNTAPEPGLAPSTHAPFTQQGPPLSQHTLGRALASEVDNKRIVDALQQLQAQMSAMHDNHASMGADLSALTRECRQLGQLLQEGSSLSSTLQGMQQLLEQQVEQAQGLLEAQTQHRAVLRVLDAGVQTSPGLDVQQAGRRREATSMRVVRRSCFVDTTYMAAAEEVVERPGAVCTLDECGEHAGDERIVTSQQQQQQQQQHRYSSHRYDVQVDVYQRDTQQVVMGPAAEAGMGERAGSLHTHQQAASCHLSDSAGVDAHLLTAVTAPRQQQRTLDVPAGDGWVQRKRGTASTGQRSQLPASLQPPSTQPNTGLLAARDVRVHKPDSSQPAQAVCSPLGQVAGVEVPRKRPGDQAVDAAGGAAHDTKGGQVVAGRGGLTGLAGLLSGGGSDLRRSSQLLCGATPRLPSLQRALAGSVRAPTAAPASQQELSLFRGPGSQAAPAPALAPGRPLAIATDAAPVAGIMCTPPSSELLLQGVEDDEELARQVADRMQRHRARRQRRL